MEISKADQVHHENQVKHIKESLDVINTNLDKKEGKIRTLE